MRKQRKISKSSKKTIEDPRILENPKVNIKLKLSILWITLLWFYAYNDIISMFRQDIHEDALAGEFGGIAMTPEFLVGASLLMTIPIIMIFLSTVLPARINRTTNIIVGIFHAVLLAATAAVPGETWAHYAMYMGFEGVVILLIICFAWKWPLQKGNS